MEKVAFLFLTRGDLHKTRLWRAFFDAASPNCYSIYVHNSKPIQDDWFGSFALSTTVETQWGTVSLVRATKLLLQHAVRDPSNKRFVLASESCVPLYCFDELYKRAMAQPLACISTIAASNDHLRDRWQRVADKNRLPFADFTKHHQWFMLDRDTAVFFADADLTWLFADVEACDEHYFSNACRMFRLPVRSKQITYVDWTNRTVHPRTFEAVTNDLIQKARSTGCLLLRKVSPDTILDEGFLLH